MTKTKQVSPKKKALHLAAIAGINAVLSKAKSGVKADIGSVLHRSEVTQVIPTGIEALDKWALGIGGIAGGRVIEVFGAKSCLDAETFIQYTAHRDDGSRMNSKGGTIERLYERFSGKLQPERGRPAEQAAFFTAPCMDAEGRIFLNRILDVVKTGEQECFEIITESGLRVVATANHKFWVGGQYLPVSKLAEGSTVFIHNRTPYTREAEEQMTRRAYCNVRFHPVAGAHDVTPINERTRTVRTYTYHRLARARAVVEARLNGLTLQEFLDKLNGDPSEISSMKFLSRTQHVHHLNEVVDDDEPSNLVILDTHTHNKHHAQENCLGSFMAVPDEVVSIRPVGVRRTFDLRMEKPFNNYVAAGFVVHNSGKTTLAYSTIANAQRQGWLAVLCETENAYEKARAQTLGVDIDTLVVVQPERTEDVARVIVETLKAVRAEDKDTPILLVWDSLAATSTKRELEGDIGDAQMADKARLLNQVVRIVSHSLTRLNAAWLIVNQTREKVGVFFGSSETTPGGNAIRFQATHQVRVSAGKVLTEGGQPVGTEVKFKVVKNKVAPPQREVMAHLIYDKGWDETWNTINHAKEVKAVPDSTQVTEKGYAAARKALGWGALPQEKQDEEEET